MYIYMKIIYFCMKKVSAYFVRWDFYHIKELCINHYTYYSTSNSIKVILLINMKGVLGKVVREAGQLKRRNSLRSALVSQILQ